MASDHLLIVRGLTASVDGKTILDDVNLEVDRGQTHIIMGPNGAGKSTLGHVVMGDPAYKVEHGDIEFEGKDMVPLSPDKRSHAGIFMSFQAPVEIPGVPVSSFLRAAASGRGESEMKGKQFRRHVRELAEELDMDPAYLDRELGVGFSGGEKKKLEMLQLLLLAPKLAILDETDSGLDVDALGVVSRGIDAYHRTCDGTLVIITHNTRILERLEIDRVHVLVKGRIVAEGNDSLVGEIDAHGFERFERQAAESEGNDPSASATETAAPEAPSPVATAR